VAVAFTSPMNLPEMNVYEQAVAALRQRGRDTSCCCSS
jgi:hypothetical protein